MATLPKYIEIVDDDGEKIKVRVQAVKEFKVNAKHIPKEDTTTLTLTPKPCWLINIFADNQIILNSDAPEKS